MNCPPLCVIQARYNSQRLLGKMLLPIGGRSLIRWAWDEAVTAFGAAHVVVAIPSDAWQWPLADHVRTFNGALFEYQGDSADVLGRLHACAHTRRHDPSDRIVRITPDDFPIDLTRERFTLGWLDRMHETVTDPHLREHMGRLLPGRTEINTRADYEFVAAYHTEQPQASPFDGGPWSPC